MAQSRLWWLRMDRWSGTADQDEDYRHGWWYLRTLSLPVFCFTVTTLPVSCLSNIIYLTPSLSGGNLWTGKPTVASLWNEFVCWVYSKNPLASLWAFLKNWPNKHLAPKFAHLLDSWYSLAAGVCIAFVVFACSAPWYLGPQRYMGRGVDQYCKGWAEYVGVRCTVMPFKMAVLLLSMHPLFN